MKSKISEVLRVDIAFRSKSSFVGKRTVDLQGSRLKNSVEDTVYGKSDAPK